VALAATIMMHRGFGTIVDPLVQLPSNLEKGVNDVLQLGHLRAQSVTVKENSEAALMKCGVTAVALCQTGIPSPGFRNSTTTTELNHIVNAFETTLSIVETVANDKYLGIDQFAAAGRQIAIIRANLTQFQNMQQPLPCQATNEFYCSIHSASDTLVNGANLVQQGVDQILGNENVKDYEKIADRVKQGIHALPYIYWVGILFLLCFMCNKRPSCKGGPLPCCECSFFLIFFIVSFLVAIVVVALGVVIEIVAQDHKFGDPFEGKPTADELVAHIKNNFQAFYNLVLKDMIEGGEETFKGYKAFFVAHVMLAIYASTCCCGLYVDKPEPKDEGSGP